MTFSDATAVTEIANGDGPHRRFAARVHEGWDIAGNANGGYLLAIAARAMATTAGRADPVSVTAHYLRPGRPGAVAVDAEVVKEGKTFATVSATLRDADDRPLLALVGSFGDLERSADEPAALSDAEPPELPEFGSLDPLPATDAFPPPFMANVDLRLHPDDGGFRAGQKSGQARMRGWFALPGDQRIDTFALLQATDAFPPTIFNTDLPVAWTPTLELTAHVRARPAPGPLRCVFTTRFVTGGFLEEDGLVWDSTGRLVAQSRQLALVPRG